MCIDCLKDQPEKMQYMQMNSRHFVRIPKFITQVINPELSAYDLDKIDQIR